MKLTQIKITRMGPFYFTHQMEFEPSVTILTGSNDSGKSSMLRFLKMFLEKSTATEMDVNQEYLQESQITWTKDQSIEIGAYFDLSVSEARTANQQWGNNYRDGDYVSIKRAMAIQGAEFTTEATSSVFSKIPVAVDPPKIICPNVNDEIRHDLDLIALNPLESALLGIGFGGQFDINRFKALSRINRTRQLREAEERINKQMERVMPIPACLRFHLSSMEGNENHMGLFLRDRHDSMTPFGLHGTGVKKMMTLLAELLVKSRSSEHQILVLDEPENSLHPDAQHLLREFLYSLTTSGRLQVIYATHSPCMINPMRTEQIRLLKRATKEGKASSFIERQASDANFLELRTSLGISAADSLLFAPVTVVIEGDTEFKCLAALIKKLTAAKTSGFEDAPKLLSLSHFLDGAGDSYELLCRVAKSQGTQVVLFLDGDKRQMVTQQKVAEIHPEIPIILLPNRDEFEQLIPVEFYFDALADKLGQAGTGKELYGAWQVWLKEDDKRVRLAFSKQVWRWVEDKFDNHTVTKPSVMRKAVELTPAGRINAYPLRTLLDAIRKQLSNTSFS